MHVPSRIQFYPLTPARWKDFETLFGESGACGGCWCMWPRLRRADFQKQKGPGNKKAMKRLVESGPPPGLLAYADGRPVAWCALAPRETYLALTNSRILKPVDDQPVWSVVCFFVAKPYRRRGLSARLLEEAAKYARDQGARIVVPYRHLTLRKYTQNPVGRGTPPMMASNSLATCNVVRSYRYGPTI